jgi:hypothetical protein
MWAIGWPQAVGRPSKGPLTAQGAGPCSPLSVVVGTLTSGKQNENVLNPSPSLKTVSCIQQLFHQSVFKTFSRAGGNLDPSCDAQARRMLPKTSCRKCFKNPLLSITILRKKQWLIQHAATCREVARGCRLPVGGAEAVDVTQNKCCIAQHVVICRPTSCSASKLGVADHKKTISALWRRGSVLGS